LEHHVPNQHRRALELLAPAGGPEALRAAIANGANAVYLGVERLNARRGAQNFTLDGLADVCRFAHLRDVRVYLTVNVVLLPAELQDALDLVDEAWASGVDAVIVQDLGLLSVLAGHLPHVRLHSSTQLNAHNTLTVRLLGRLGASRVTVAREVSIEEIAAFVRDGGVEIESFVHGALCMCYSGQCLMSSLIGRRSANRGQCAQPCRLPYELVGDDGTELETPGAHLLSPRDLAGISILPALVGTGVAALKIEGRMKSPEYVALVTGVYRGALDRLVAGPSSFEVRDGERDVLAEAFSRGFSEAYLIGESGNEMMSYRRPNNRGVLVGRVVKAEEGRSTVALESELDEGDTIEFWTSAGRFAQVVGRLEIAGEHYVTAPASALATIVTEQRVADGDRVFRVRNATLASAASRTFEPGADEGSVGLDFEVTLLVGEPLRATVRDSRGRTGTATGPVIEPARTKCVTAEEIAEHIGRLGGTQYRIGRFDLELSPGAGVGFSVLHRARRDAIADYEASRLEEWSARERGHPTFGPSRHRAPRRPRIEIVAETWDVEVAVACLEAGADAVHVPTYALRHAHVPQGVVPLISRVLHDREIGAALAFAEEGGHVVAGNLGALDEAARRGAQVEAHWSLNALNVATVEELARLGAIRVWLSPELTGRQLAQIAGATGVETGTAVYGRQEVMVTEHCVLMAEGECDRRCATCARRIATRSLRDRKRYLFPIRTDPTGRSHVFNSVPLDLADALAEVVATGVSSVRLDLHTVRAADASRATARVRKALDSISSGTDRTVTRDEQATSGHFFRGVS
jgi:putative protease